MDEWGCEGRQSSLDVAIQRASGRPSTEALQRNKGQISVERFGFFGLGISTKVAVYLIQPGNF